MLASSFFISSSNKVISSTNASYCLETLACWLATQLMSLSSFFLSLMALFCSLVLDLIWLSILCFLSFASSSSSATAGTHHTDVNDNAAASSRIIIFLIRTFMQASRTKSTVYHTLRCLRMEMRLPMAPTATPIAMYRPIISSQRLPKSLNLIILFIENATSLSSRDASALYA